MEVGVHVVHTTCKLALRSVVWYSTSHIIILSYDRLKSLTALSEIHPEVFCLKRLYGNLRFEDRLGIGTCRNAVHCMAGFFFFSFSFSFFFFSSSSSSSSSRHYNFREVLSFPTNSFHLGRFLMQSLQFVIFILVMSLFTSSSKLFSKNTRTSNFVKIRRVATELFRADGQTWRRQQSLSAVLRTRVNSDGTPSDRDTHPYTEHTTLSCECPVRSADPLFYSKELPHFCVRWTRN